jgi:lysophospholipase L1-like esterase
MLVPLHQAYVQATREIAEITGAYLCDAADAMEKLGPNRRFYFFSDGVHFNARGDAFMGDFVATCIASAVKDH